MIANGTCSHRAITDIKAAGIPHNRFVIILHRVQRILKYWRMHQRLKKKERKKRKMHSRFARIKFTRRETKHHYEQ